MTRYSYRIEQDTEPANPRTEFDNLGTLAAYHRHYTLSDKEVPRDPDDLREMLNSGEYIYLPVFGYDHGSLTISTNGGAYPFNDRWDSGQLGYIYVSKKDVKREYSCLRISKRTERKVLDVLRGEVAEFDAYLTGNVYGYIVEDERGENIDSCWGFYGDEGRKEAERQAKSIIAHLRTAAHVQHFQTPAEAE